MDNKQYITRLSKRASLNYKETQQLVTSVIAMVNEVLAEGDTLAIPAFGNFSVQKQEEYIGFDRTTGQRMLYPPHIEVKFTPGTILAKTISNQQ